MRKIVIVGLNRAIYKDGSPYRIVFTDVLLQKLREKHGSKLIPIVHKMHELYLFLSNQVVGIDSSDLDDKANLGQRLMNYLLKLSEEAAILEQNYNCFQAKQKYSFSLFICEELQRDLSNNLKFSDQSGSEDRKTFASFTFVQEDLNSQQILTDPKEEKVLSGLAQLIQRRIENVQKSPYYE